MALRFQTMRVGSVDPSTAGPGVRVPNGTRYLYLSSSAWEVWTYHSARPEGRRWIKLSSVPVDSGFAIVNLTQAEYDALSPPDSGTIYIIA